MRFGAGTRLRLHFDGHSVRFDFWVDSDSRDMFPCGWTERQRTAETGVQPPPGRRHAPFVWRNYLRDRHAVAAPEDAFACVAHEEKPFQRVGPQVGRRDSLSVSSAGPGLLCRAIAKFWITVEFRE